MTLDTVYALATPMGQSALAVVRISGPQTHGAISQLTRREPPAPRRAVLRRLLEPQNDALIDEAEVTCFSGSSSYTGEDSAEISIHGSVAVLNILAEALEDLGLRLAKPGEISRRALLNARHDLARAEGVAELIAAETEAQRKHALSLLTGALADKVAVWRNELVSVLAILESAIDFVDEDLGEHWIEHAGTRADAFAKLLSDEETQADITEDLLAPSRIVLVGPPNSGKSSLLNALAQKDAAIVSDIPGTTRDVISSRVVVDGVAIDVVDTAGLRETSDSIEKIGVQRAQAELKRADLVIFLISDDTFAEAAELLKGGVPASEVFWTKSDTVSPNPEQLAALAPASVRSVSVFDGSARKAFREVARFLMQKRTTAISPIAGSQRRKRLLSEARELSSSAASLIKDNRIELAVEDLRSAANTLEALVGEIGSEDVLDEVFSRFCIGK
ncbi:MAG: tRNA uridine-5-carboxymethylaminomethyl(34) synthesis GTPase MnmE [Neomegalonema sp.]